MVRPKIVLQDEEKTKKTTLFITEYFVLKWPTESMKLFAGKIQKQVDSRKDWPSELYQEVMNRTRFIKTRVSIDINKIDYTETVLGFCDEWKKKVSLREKPFQKTIAESTKKGKK